ncbi:TetR/AcrR family transcriptional regulator [Amycolatopsis sp. NBC_01488]|uniref:TetR/AcrR family transcriptional regulator n=1 Tax=Amycolatopsis sp. NBC_01488 TaxID=2903563 RepID=UPI002E2985ED|nr:TetR/AcrR family transcriptional regulator [Amycolatopsis sp. NBC_01488]
MTSDGGRRAAILRAAEKVFAREGYDGATMRQIAAEADAKLSLVVYHFTSKLGLYVAIFENRQYVNEERLARLAAIPDLRAEDAVEQIVHAFADPVLALHDDPDDIWFARLVMREASDPSSQERPVIAELFDPMAREFIKALRAALPGKPDGFHHWAYLFAVGALTKSSYEVRVSNLTDKPLIDRKQDILRSFIVAALRYG